MRHWNYYTSKLLQIPISEMSVIEASLTPSFLDQYQCSWWKVGDYRPVFRLPFDFCSYISLLYRRECILTRMYFQTFLLRNLSVWEITPLILYVFIKRRYAYSNYNFLLQHIRKTLPTKLAALKNSVRWIHGARGPAVGPHWIAYFWFLHKALFWFICQ